MICKRSSVLACAETAIHLGSILLLTSSPIPGHTPDQSVVTLRWVAARKDCSFHPALKPTRLCSSDSHLAVGRRYLLRYPMQLRLSSNTSRLTASTSSFEPVGLSGLLVYAKLLQTLFHVSDSPIISNFLNTSYKFWCRVPVSNRVLPVFSGLL
jgi:hypothetical protein